MNDNRDRTLNASKITQNACAIALNLQLVAVWNIVNVEFVVLI
jgi:hypothetical protein